MAGVATTFLYSCVILSVCTVYDSVCPSGLFGRRVTLLYVRPDYLSDWLYFCMSVRIICLTNYDSVFPVQIIIMFDIYISALHTRYIFVLTPGPPGAALHARRYRRAR